MPDDEHPPTLGGTLTEAFKERQAEEMTALVKADMPGTPALYRHCQVSIERIVGQLEAVRTLGAMMVSSGMLRRDINTPEKAAMIIIKGYELGIPPMVALTHIYVVDQKPALESKLMLALYLREHGDESVRWVECSPTACRLRIKRRGENQYTEFAFTIEDAKRAGLTGKGVWDKYPQFMLRHRCISMAINAMDPRCTCGMVTPEELGQTVRVTDEGEVITVTCESHESAPAPADAEGDQQAADEVSAVLEGTEDAPLQCNKFKKGDRIRFRVAETEDSGWFRSHHINGGMCASTAKGKTPKYPKGFGPGALCEAVVGHGGSSKTSGRPFAFLNDIIVIEAAPGPEGAGEAEPAPAPPADTSPPSPAPAPAGAPTLEEARVKAGAALAELKRRDPVAANRLVAQHFPHTASLANCEDVGKLIDFADVCAAELI